MRKVFRLENLDCANCAAKMERAIGKLEGVESASVNFMTQKLTIHAAEDQMGTILTQAENAVKKIEPDCVIVAV